MGHMRRSVALSLISALLLALVRAPFFHLHSGRDHGPHEPGHHNLLLILHTHLKSFSESWHHSGETKLDVPNSEREEQAVNMLLLKQESPPSLPVQAEQLAFLSPLVCKGLAMHEPTPRTHDPPFNYSSIPRSPPI